MLSFWGLVCTHVISSEFDSFWKLNYKYLTSQNLDFDPNGYYVGS